MTRILSIQSSVAYGHVGNSAATFPLMRSGVEVMPVLTVHFAASTLYGPAHGPLLTPDQVGDVVAGLDEIDALSGLDAILSGFQGAPSMGARIVETVQLAKRRSPDALYCCDPVLGDVGRGFYVLPGIPEFMRDVAVPAADIVTPNHFELNYLTGHAATTLPELTDAARSLLARGPRVVLVTSADLVDADPHTISMVAVSEDGAWRVETPRIGRAFDGSGDVTAAMFVTHYLRTRSVPDALASTASILYSLLRRTADLGRHELALVAAQDEIVDPTWRFEASAL